MKVSDLFKEKTKFVGSFTDLNQIPFYNLPEICFIGRSNVGKSSLINILTSVPGLAKTSSTPGRTQTINLFDYIGKLIITDLPGYGFAKAPKDEVKKWNDFTKVYLCGRVDLRRVFLLVDSRQGIKNIDTIIVTHFDNDHCGGAVDLMNGVKVDKLYVNSIEHDSISAKSIYETAKNLGVKLILAQNNQSVEDRDGLKITNFISSESPEAGDNETSILTMLEYKGFKMLFTGDSGINAFNKLKALLPGNITVLKVGHHGALGVVNQEMIDYLKPEYSLISVGENKFGHPARYTLEILKSTKILRTDINNSVKFVVNEKGYKAYTFNIKKKKFCNI